MLKQHYRSVFISDLHLGIRGCKAGLIDDFLKHIECENLYLVGDVIDGWQLKRNWYMPQEQVNIIHRILKMAKYGTNVYWVLGNHDEFARAFLKHDLKVGNVHIANEFDYTAIDGRKFLVTHGDMFDEVMKHSWLSHLGDWVYTALLAINDRFNSIRRHFGFGYWSLSSYLKHQAKLAVEFIWKFEEHLCGYAKKRGYGGVICGHIHSAVISKLVDEDFVYMNTGDWVESCTAIVEHPAGGFDLRQWSNHGQD